MSGKGCALRKGAFALVWGLGALLLSDALSAQQSWSCSGPEGSGACLPWGDTRVVVDGYITAISADGSVVAGTTTSNLQAWRFKKGEPIKFLTIPGATKVIPGSEQLVNIGSESREAQRISANGSKIVGIARFSTVPTKRAFYWNADSTIDNDFFSCRKGQHQMLFEF